MSDVEFSHALASAGAASPNHRADTAECQRVTTASIARLAGVPASTRAILLALTRISDGALLLRLPDGRHLRFGDALAPPEVIHIHSHRFAKRILANGDIGFAEGWIEEEWSSPDLASLLSLLAGNAERFMATFCGGPIGQALNWLAHIARPNTRAGSRQNILAHYDLGNRFFETWLDASMTYSAARFDLADSLEQAQNAKYRALADRLKLKAGEHVLEIGCGWGGFAEVAARDYGARVSAVTISDEQFAYAQARMQRAGLSDKVDVRLLDYRDLEGQFDKIASIEMFEAVGEKNWPTFFAKVTEVLRPGGAAAMQVITVRDDLFDGYRRRADFIQRYIFPGGMLPSLTRLTEEANKAGLQFGGAEAFGEGYAKTLAEWARRFRDNWQDIRALGFDERFKRLWLFYLCYCEAGFRTERTNVVHIGLLKAG